VKILAKNAIALTGCQENSFVKTLEVLLKTPEKLSAKC